MAEERTAKLSDVLANLESRRLKLYEEKNYKEVEKMYSNMLDFEKIKSGQSSSELAIIFNNRGHSRYLQVDFNSAVHDYTKAIGLEPSLAVAYYNRATVLYRMGKFEGSLADFEKSVELDHSNEEFLKGMENCRKSWIETIEQPVKLLFLISHSIGDRENYDADDQEDARTFAKAVELGSIESIKDRLKQRENNILREENFMKIPLDTVGRVQKACNAYRNLMTYVASRQSLDMQLEQMFSNSINQFKEKLAGNVSNNFESDEACHNIVVSDGLTASSELLKPGEEVMKEYPEMLMDLLSEKRTYTFVNSSNQQLLNLCSNLSAGNVRQMLKHWQSQLDEMPFKAFPANMQFMDRYGMKEAAFSFIILSMKINGLLNRSFSSCLTDLVKSSTKSQQLLMILGTYALSEKLPGYCLIIRAGSRDCEETEVEKIKQTFSIKLRFDIDVELGKNIDKAKFEEVLQNLEKPKFLKYDSLVVFFIGHGGENVIELANSEMYDRNDFIDGFAGLKTFQQKPIIIFLTSCRGKRFIAQQSSKSVSASPEAGRKVATIPKHFSCSDLRKDTKTLGPRSNMLIGYSTLPGYYAFMREASGSAYVNLLCDTILDYQGQNIYLVLEAVKNNIEATVFNVGKSEYKFTSSKQAPYFKSFFLKSFVVPYAREQYDNDSE